MKRILFLFASLLLSLSLYSQTASVTSGCVPLVVEFQAPNAGSYFWDFKDSASSVLQNPDHTFTDAGTFDVDLRDSEGGTIVGTVSITVYPDPIIAVDPSVFSGCAPLTVDFASMIQLDPALTLESILWSFGDGQTSDVMDPVHTYTTTGNFTVSLQIVTNEIECDKTELFAELINVQSVGEVEFEAELVGACTAPATVQITNNSTNSPSLTYEWDFGNSTTSNSYNPGTITYDTDGPYTISLTVSDNIGCSETFTQPLTVGLPVLEFDIPDTVCLNVEIPIINTTSTSNFFWEFGDDASVFASAQREPAVTFDVPGIQTIEFSAFDNTGCVSTTVFEVFVEELILDLTVSPTEGCLNPMPVQLTTNSGYQSYIWNETESGGAVYDFEINCPVRDSLHINLLDSVPLIVEVTSFAGCVGFALDTFILRKPYAHFLPSTTRGCAPLEVVFVDTSLSLNGIENLFWDLGDGTEVNDESEVTHTYTQPGEYYVQLTVETSEGCRDTSAGRWIFVGAPIAPEYTISDTDICLHESVEISLDNNDPNIDGWHVYTDDSRTGHCFLDNTMTHQFSTQPGVFDVEFSINYNGCITDTTVPDQITVNGANSDISHMINCETPYDIMLKNDGLNADMVTWLLDSVQISSLDSLMYTFPDRGDYLITLITEDTGSGCPADTTSVDIFIREPVASFEMAERVCDNIPYALDASASIDVDNDCSQGYLWKLPFSRPREVSSTSIQHQFPEAGVHEVMLIVEDMHGCRDTTSKTTESYGIYSNIAVDTDRTCLPDSVTYTNLSTSDTTLVVTDWSFGSSDDVAIAYHETTPPGDSLNVTLVLEDALGCQESISHTLSLYTPESNLFLDNGPGICVGETIVFTATDYTNEGSFLDFNWDFGTLGTMTGQTVSMTFDEPGEFPVKLTFQENSTGCGGEIETLIEVVPVPIADFSSSFDGVNPICYPAQIELTNLSTTVGPVETEWYTDGQGPFSGENPTFAFDKGTHEVMLVSRSEYGCADTTAASYLLVGPEGDFSIDPEEICIGDEITLTLFDTVDVSGWEWDFGDGTILSNGDPVKHTYTFKPNSGNTNISLTLFSEETSCEVIETIPVSVEGPVAMFEKIDSLDYCEGIAFFNNLSTDADQYSWFADGAPISNEFEPRVDFGANGTFDVTLVASVAGSDCTSEISAEITLDPVPDFIQFPNVFTPNGDGTNDNFNFVITEPGFEEFINVITFKVYDRWGQLLYDNDNPAVGWNGRFEDDEAPTEVYAYYIEYEIIDCNNESMKGNVTIIR